MSRCSAFDQYSLTGSSTVRSTSSCRYVTVFLIIAGKSTGVGVGLTQSIPLPDMVDTCTDCRRWTLGIAADVRQRTALQHTSRVC